MRAIEGWVEPDQRNPVAKQPSILARRDVLACVAATRKELIAEMSRSSFEPSCQRLSGRIRQLERHRTAGLLLDDRCPQPHGSAKHDITHAKPDEITAT